jgi:hypothetical protein
MRPFHGTACAATTALAVAAIMAVPVAAAAPDNAPLEPPFVGFCQWKVAGPEVVLSSPAGIPVQMETDGGRWFTEGRFTSKDYNRYRGPAYGGVVEGTNQLDFTVEFKPQSLLFESPSYTSHYTGSINANGSAQGTVLDDKGATKNWSTDSGFVCVPTS